MTEHGRLLERARWHASHAEFSEDRRHRYTLTRVLDPHLPRLVQFIGLNPSTADHYIDDNTVRRCIDFARRWGYGTFVMTNIFALRSTNPKALYAREAIEIYTDALRIYRECEGRDNEAALLSVARRAVTSGGIVVAAWGTHGGHLGQGAKVRARLVAAGIELHCLGRTKGGQPRHPLYLSKSTPLEAYA